MIRRLLIALVYGYRRFISPLKPPTCRYYPTCSQYAIQALRLHGPLRGSWLATRRICRCHPWGGHGFDPVPGADPQAHWDDAPGTSQVGRQRAVARVVYADEDVRAPRGPTREAPLGDAPVAPRDADPPSPRNH